MDQAEEILERIAKRASSSTPCLDLLHEKVFLARREGLKAAGEATVRLITCAPTFAMRLRVEAGSDKFFRLSYDDGGLLFLGIRLQESPLEVHPFRIHLEP